MTAYNATASEARAFWSGEKTAIILPMEPQPYTDTIRGRHEIESPGLLMLARANPPFRHGQRVGVKEPWDRYKEWAIQLGRPRFCYSADNPGENYWQPAETMPPEAERQWFVPDIVEARRVKDVTEDEAIRLGFEPPYARDEYICWWLELYPQYPYDSNPWIWYGEGKVVKTNP